MSPEAAARYGSPAPAFTFLLGMRLRSRGSVRLADADPAGTPVIETGYFAEPEDLRDAVDAYRFAETVADAPYRGADASVLPRVTSGNTMAPCVVVGYRAAAPLAAGDENTRLTAGSAPTPAFPSPRSGRRTPSRSSR